MTVHLKNSVSSIFRMCVAISSPVILISIGLQSRPSADEYLLGPVLNGFYVDRSDGFLFNPSNNLFLRYLQGTKAIYELGWDGLLNAATLQMGSSILVNYFGPIAPISQSILFAGVFWCFLYIVNSRFFQLSGLRLHCGILIMLSATLAAFAFADFNTYRENFGFFPFTGIRFGIYAFSTWLLLLVISYFEYQLCSNITKIRFYFLIACFAGFTSLWFIMFWFVYLIVSFCTCALYRDNLRLQFRRLHLIVAAITFISVLINQNLLSIFRNRSSLPTSNENGGLVDSLIAVLSGNYKRLFSFELWNLSFGVQLYIGVGTGVFISILFKLVFENIAVITTRMVVNILIMLTVLPLLFYIQEQVTYEAWWHRTPLIALSFISGLIIGVYVATRYTNLDSRPRTSLLITTSIIFVLGLPRIIEHAEAISDYRERWDKGDLFGTQSPVANSELYNQINVLKLKPYRHPNWIPNKDVLTHVSVAVSRKSDSEFVPLQPNELTDNAIIMISDPILEAELFREVSISFLISFSGGVAQGSFLRVTDSDSTTIYKLSPGKANRISVNSSVPDRISLDISNSPEFSFGISDLQLDFGPKFKAIWDIND